MDIKIAVPDSPDSVATVPRRGTPGGGSAGVRRFCWDFPRLEKDFHIVACARAVANPPELAGVTKAGKHVGLLEPMSPGTH